MKLHQKIFFSAVMCSSLALAMNNTCLVTSSGNYLSKESGLIPITPQCFLKDVPKSTGTTAAHAHYGVTKTEFLQQAADKIVYNREMRACVISDRIDQEYIGIGDQWSLQRQLSTWLGWSGTGYTKAKDAMEDITTIYSYMIGANCNVDRPFIDAVRAKNYRFDTLVTLLIKKKFQTFGPFFRQLGGSTIDQFLDSEYLFPGLPKPLQEYIEFKNEEQYRLVFHIDRCVPFVPHLLRTTFQYSKLNKDELERLLQSSTLKKVDRDTRIIFTELIKGELAKFKVDGQCRCADGSDSPWVCNDCDTYEDFSEKRI
jgi:hypothetical protein